jgi:hypothetical protein
MDGGRSKSVGVHGQAGQLSLAGSQSDTCQISLLIHYEQVP